MAKKKEENKKGFFTKVWDITGRRKTVYVLLAILTVLAVASFVFTYPIYRVNYLIGNGIISLSEAPSVENSLVNTSAQIVAGFLLLVGLWFTYRRILATERNVEIAQKTFQTTEKGEITERLNNAISHLNDESLSVTIGGIYGLKRIAAEDVGSKETIIEILSSYLTENTEKLKIDRENPDFVLLPALKPAKHNVTQCFDAVMDLKKSDKKNITKISKSNLVQHNINFKEFYNIMFSEFDLINFSSLNSSITECAFIDSFWWEVSIDHTTFKDSHFKDVALYNCSLNRSKIDGITIIDTIFNNSVIIHNSFENRVSPMMNCTYINCDISSNTYEDYTLLNCKFNNSPCHGNKYIGCSFNNCDFMYLQLSNNTFIDCTFISTHFRNDVIVNNSFENCDFSNSEFIESEKIEKNTFINSFDKSLLKSEIELQHVLDNNTIKS